MFRKKPMCSPFQHFFPLLFLANAHHTYRDSFKVFCPVHETALDSGAPHIGHSVSRSYPLRQSFPLWIHTWCYDEIWESHCGACVTWLRNQATPVLVLTVVQIWVPDLAVIVAVISTNERTLTVASYFRGFYSDEHWICRHSCDKIKGQRSLPSAACVQKQRNKTVYEFQTASIQSQPSCFVRN